MGKGNRTRNERATSTLASVTPRQASKKKSMPTWVGTLIVVAVLALLVLFVTFIVLNARGTFLRMRTFAESEHYEVTVPMMSYMVYTEYQNRVALYDQYSTQFGTTVSIGGGEGGDALDRNKSLRAQKYGVLKDGETVINENATWFDHFAYNAEKDVKQILACCEEARLYGMELDDADYAAIEAQLDAIETYAAQNGYTTNGYVSVMFGQGVILKDVRNMMKLTQLASKWSEFKAQEFLSGVTDARAEEYYVANKATYDVFCDYTGYVFAATFTASKKTDANEAKTENEQNAAKYEQEKERFAGYVKTLSEAADEVDFRAKLSEILYQEELLKAKEAKTDGSELTEDEKSACRAAADKATLAAVCTNKEEKDEGTNESKMYDWLFESKTENGVKTYVRKAGDKTMLEDKKNAYDDPKEGEEKVYKDATSVYSACVFNGGMHRNNEIVRSVGHILFKADTYDGLTSTEKLSGVAKELADKVLARDGIITAYAMAAELLDMLFAEGKITEATREDGSKYYKIDKAVFEEYGELYTEDGSVFYDDVEKGQMVAEFEEWLFAKSRVEGEITYTEPVETEYGYHIMYYVGSETEMWKSEIRTKISDEENTAYLENIQTVHSVTVNANYYRYIQG